MNRIMTLSDLRRESNTTKLEICKKEIQVELDELKRTYDQVRSLDDKKAIELKQEKLEKGLEELEDRINELKNITRDHSERIPRLEQRLNNLARNRSERTPILEQLEVYRLEGGALYRFKKQLRREVVFRNIGFFLVFLLIALVYLDLNNKINNVSTRLEVLRDYTVEGFAEVHRQISDLNFNFNDFKTSVIVQFENVKYAIGEVKEYATDLHQKLNTTYEKLIEHEGWLQRIDKAAVAFIGDRSWFLLGCYPAGTMIATSDGKQTAIENINRNTKLENPSRGVNYALQLMIGSETGKLYYFTTSDNLTVAVTSGHPMKIKKREGWTSIVAKDVQVGEQTVTVNGIQKISSIKQEEVENVLVYNIFLDLPDDVPMNDRIIVANGIHTFDLKVQQQIASYWDVFDSVAKDLKGVFWGQNE